VSWARLHQLASIDRPAKRGIAGTVSMCLAFQEARDFNPQLQNKPFAFNTLN
jgi:hypothetical protein